MLKKEWQRKFKPEFFKRCCKLICEAKPNDKPKYLSGGKYKKPEDFITYDYVELIKKVDIKREKVRTECGSKQKCGNGTTFKEPDITFSTLDNKVKTFFECKILGSNSQYINKGVQRFVIERYSFKNMPFYGMLGYIKDDDSATKRYIKLERSIDGKKNELNLTNQEIAENSDSQVIFKTKHKIINAECNSNIEITHILHCWEPSLAVVQ